MRLERPCEQGSLWRGKNRRRGKFQAAEIDRFQENGVTGGAEQRMHARTALIAAVARRSAIMARDQVGMRCVREAFMMRGRCSVEMAYLRKCRRPAADQGAEKGKGKHGDAHAGKIGTRRTK